MITEFDRGYITAETYAACGVLGSGFASMETLRKWVTKAYSADVADEVFPVQVQVKQHAPRFEVLDGGRETSE